MSGIHEIEQAVSALSPQDLSRFRAWFLEFDSAVLDELSNEREASSSAMLSEVALSDWMRREEDAAWAHLQQGR